jgi:hypothetical protein
MNSIGAARWIFWLAGLYGLVVLSPQYFLERTLGEDYPPPVTHPELFYGFLGVAIAWQIAFLMIGYDPTRYRPMIIPSVIEKVSFGAAVVVLFINARVPAMVLTAGIIDLVWAALFLFAWQRLGQPAAQAAA